MKIYRKKYQTGGTTGNPSSLALAEVFITRGYENQGMGQNDAMIKAQEFGNKSDSEKIAELQRLGMYDRLKVADNLFNNIPVAQGEPLEILKVIDQMTDEEIEDNLTNQYFADLDDEPATTDFDNNSPIEPAVDQIPVENDTMIAVLTEAYQNLENMSFNDANQAAINALNNGTINDELGRLDYTNRAQAAQQVINDGSQPDAFSAAKMVSNPDLSDDDIQEVIKDSEVPINTRNVTPISTVTADVNPLAAPTNRVAQPAVDPVQENRQSLAELYMADGLGEQEAWATVDALDDDTVVNTLQSDVDTKKQSMIKERVASGMSQADAEAQVSPMSNRQIATSLFDTKTAQNIVPQDNLTPPALGNTVGPTQDPSIAPNMSRFDGTRLPSQNQNKSGIFQRNYGIQNMNKNRGDITYGDNEPQRSKKNPLQNLKAPQFLKDGMSKLRQGFKNRKDKAQARKDERQKALEAERWYDEKMENKSLRDKIRDRRGEIRDAEKEERLDKRGSRLERRLGKADNKLEREEARNPLSTKQVEGRSLLNQDLDDLRLKSRMSKDKGVFDRKKERMERRKYDQMERAKATAEVQPFIEGQKAEGRDLVTAARKIKSDNRAAQVINKGIDKGVNTLERMDNKAESLKERQRRKSIRRNLNRFNKDARKDLSKLRDLKLSSKDPAEKEDIQGAIDSHKESFNEIRKGIIENPLTDTQPIPKNGLAPKFQAGGRLNRFSMFNPDYIGSTAPQLNSDVMEDSMADKFGYSTPEASTTTAIGNNQFLNRPTLSTSSNPVVARNTTTPVSTTQGEAIESSYDPKRLTTYGNKLQATGVGVPAFFNLAKSFDDPTVQQSILPKFTAKKRFMNPNMLEVARQNAAARRQVAGTARGAQNYLANVQQLHANTAHLAQNMANRAKTANLQESRRYDAAKQQYENMKANERKRVEAANLQHKLAKEQGISDTMRELGKYWIQKGTLHNQELADHNRVQAANQLTQDYSMFTDRFGRAFYRHNKTGKILNAGEAASMRNAREQAMLDTQAQIAADNARARVATTKRYGGRIKGLRKRKNRFK